MKGLVKLGAAFLLGAGVGGAGVWIFLKKKFDKHLRAHDEEIQKLENYYAKKYDEEVPEKVSEAEVEAPSEYKGDGNGPAEVSLMRKTRRDKIEPVNTHKVDYTSYFSGDTEGGEENMNFEELEHPKDDGAEDPEFEENYYSGLEATSELRNRHGIKFIKAVDYGTDPSFSPRTLLYYQDNDTLVIDGDSNQEAVDDLDEIASMIGDGLTKFGFKNDAEPVIYIRNFDRGCDYMITKVFDAFAEY